MEENIVKYTALIFILIVSGCYFTQSKNPFKEVEWIEDSPGATSRYIEFTPVLKTNTKIILGPTVGADYAEIRFEDLNNDGIKEVIIETNSSFHLEQYHAERHILEYTKAINKEPKFVLIKSEILN